MWRVTKCKNWCYTGISVWQHTDFPFQIDCITKAELGSLHISPYNIIPPERAIRGDVLNYSREGISFPFPQSGHPFIAQNDQMPKTGSGKKRTSALQGFLSEKKQVAPVENGKNTTEKNTTENQSKQRNLNLRPKED